MVIINWLFNAKCYNLFYQRVYSESKKKSNIVSIMVIIHHIIHSYIGHPRWCIEF